MTNFRERRLDEIPYLTDLEIRHRIKVSRARIDQLNRYKRQRDSVWFRWLCRLTDGDTVTGSEETNLELSLELEATIYNDLIAEQVRRR